MRSILLWTLGSIQNPTKLSQEVNSEPKHSADEAGF
jgi:hypothetical protein